MERAKSIRYFLFGQHLADGLRVTLTIIAPSLFYALAGDIETGVQISLGALCLSISDAPGPVKHKRNGMFYCLVFVTLMALLTGFLNHSILGMGILIVTATFFFSMFNIYGSRATSVGTAALLIMILRMAHLLPAVDILKATIDIAIGGVWYMLSAMGFYILVPNRPAQRALGNCISETAKYLMIKSELYDLNSDYEISYRRLLDQQEVVNEKQNEVRELLFKTRSYLKESTYEGRLLLVTFVATVDLFEQIMATWYDYNELRKKYKDLNVLNEISQLVRNLAGELSEIGMAIHSQHEYKRKSDLISRLTELKAGTEKILSGPLDVTLRKIIINLRNLGERIDRISNYFSTRKGDVKTNLNKNDYSRFVSHQKINGTLFFNNLNMHSSAFRHSLRVMITCLAGYILATMIFKGHHSYWILMTIIIILKPAYGLTKDKNKDRLIGTIGGGIIGLLLLLFIKNEIAIFCLLVIFMLGTYTYVRLNYVVMVFFLTPYVLILFHFLKLDIVDIAGERLLDTAIACVLSWLAIHYLFPRWESFTIRKNLIDVLQANRKYMNKLVSAFLKKERLSVEYKLVRKEVFVTTANLSAALHRMQSEPRDKQQHRAEIYELVVLNHVLSSNIASLFDTVNAEDISVPSSYISRLRRSIDDLEASIMSLSPSQPPFGAQEKEISPNGVDNESVKQQLEFIRKITFDIKKTVMKIAGD